VLNSMRPDWFILSGLFAQFRDKSRPF